MDVNALRAESIRLIELEIQTLQKMMAIDGLFSDKTSLTVQSAKQRIEDLKGELHKLQHFDVVIAVVGTMKAGKSTTINAIVGTEVMPNRNTPMTALPTMIRHTPHQTEPKLIFENRAPLSKFIKETQSALQQGTYQAKVEEILKSTASELRPVIERINAGQLVIQASYEGSSAIFSFLETVNDLVRLARDVTDSVPFPFEAYRQIQDLPVIEVAFAHLPKEATNEGRLILLDTPGPNEAGRPELKQMLKEQLNKASAVLLVMDYTQLKSQADEEVRQVVAGVSHPERLYLLVNKFDQKDRNGMSAEDVKSYIKDMVSGVETHHIYPVSSKIAYLSARAGHSLTQHGQLPNENWVADFGEEAFGRRWESSIQDTHAVEEGIKELWSFSGFDNPLKGSIEVAYRNASRLSLDSAKSKIEIVREVVTNIVNAQLFASQEDLEKSNKILNEIRRNLDLIKVEKTNIVEIKKKSLENIKSSSMKAKDVKNVVIDDLAESGLVSKRAKKKEDSEYHNKVKQNLTNKKSVKLDDFSEEFYDEDDARKALNKIKKKLNEYLKKSIVTIKSDIQDQLNILHRELPSSFEKVLSIINEFKSSSASKGLKLEFNIPNVSLSNLNIKSSVKLSSDLIDSDTETYTYKTTKKVEQDGFWGSIKRGAGSITGNDDWGYDNVEVDVECDNDIYRINKTRLKQEIRKSINDFFDQVSDDIKNSIEKPLTENIDTFFKDVSSKLDGIQKDLSSGLEAKNQDKEKHFLYIQAIEKISLSLNGLNIDIEALISDFERIA